MMNEDNGPSAALWLLTMAAITLAALLFAPQVIAALYASGDCLLPALSVVAVALLYAWSG